MRLRLASMLLVSLLLPLAVAHAQYVEIYRLDNLMKDLPDAQVLSSLSTDLSLPPDTLKQEKAEYKISFGELYLAHKIAKATNSDLKSVIADSRTKSWGSLAKDRKIDMDQIRDSTKKLEKVLRSSKK
jgi:hypothetical protein